MNARPILVLLLAALPNTAVAQGLTLEQIMAEPDWSNLDRSTAVYSCGRERPASVLLRIALSQLSA